MTALQYAGKVDEILLGLTHAVRAAGVPVTHDRATTFLEAAALVGAGGLAQVRLVGRATLCAGPEDIVRFEQVYAEWFAGRDDLPRRVDREEQNELVSPLPEDDGADGVCAHDLADTHRRDVRRHVVEPTAHGGIDRDIVDGDDELARRRLWDRFLGDGESVLVDLARGSGRESDLTVD